MRHRRWRHHVAPAQFRPVDAEFARRGIDQAFQQVIAFRPTGAAVGIDRHRVGEHAEYVRVDRLEAVDAGQHIAAGESRDIRREGRKIGAHVGNVACAQCQELSVRVDRQLARRDIVAALRVAEERLATIRCPLHRSTELARSVTGQHVLGVEERLHAKAAADVRRDDAEILRVRS